MKKLEEGCIIIADITGYTAYLSDSELEHAQGSLRDLLQLMLLHIKPPLVVSRLEGDAVISYAPAGSFRQGQTLVELIENTYLDFRQARERMVLNTSCACNACRNIPNLDLKFFLHFGTYSIQKLGSYNEMVGTDVNLIHRLTKNQVVETTGIGAYALYTQAAVDSLAIAELAEHMIQHTESYEHIGPVVCYVQDLNAVWLRAEDTRRVKVPIENAWRKVEIELPIAPTLAWDYVTNPEYRKLLYGADSQNITENAEGRTGTGAIYRCAHGEKITSYPILDWQPVEYFTLAETWPPPGVGTISTTHLTPTAEGTRVTLVIERPKGPFFWRKLSEVVFLLFFLKYVTQMYKDFQKNVESELQEGKLVVTEKTELSVEDINQAIEESLAA
jgi:uncharacterized protein YndB with AHSA1/START domain